MENLVVRRICSHLGRYTARVLWTPLIRVRVMSASRPLPTGKLILASNHISHFDPPIIGAFAPRQLDWMAMEELFKNPWIGRLLSAIGAFPVNRGASDRSAIRTALQRLSQGAAVGIFPEGGIRAGETSILGGAKMRPGVAVLAMIADAPIVPTVILGSERLYHRQNWHPFFRIPVWIGIGDPLYPKKNLSGAASREEFCARLQKAMIELQNRLIETYHLRSEDLPKTPQARKGEDPYMTIPR